MIADLREALCNLMQLQQETELLKMAQETLEDEALQSKTCLRVQLLLEHFLADFGMYHGEICSDLERSIKVLEKEEQQKPAKQ